MKINKKLKKEIINKLISLNFSDELFNPGLFRYSIPLGFNTALILDIEDCIMRIERFSIDIPIDRIISVEQIEVIFNALVPGQNRLPFN